MSPYRRLVGPAVALGVALTIGCTVDRALAPDARGPVLYSAAGFPVREGNVRDAMARATRLVALALGQPGVRARVFAALRDSPHREQKLHFRRFIERGGRQVLAGMAAAADRGTTQAAIGALLDSVVDLELYMPVEHHRAQWRGGEDLIVATALRDHEIPVAFDLRGRPVPLLSPETPPETPVLALVPVETDFDAGPSFAKCFDACGGGGGEPPPPPAGALMVFASITGDYEGFLMGDPEFEVHSIARMSLTESAIRDLQCSGQHAAGAAAQPGIKSIAYAYDQNAENWSGQVLLLSAAQLAAAQLADSAVIYWIWEDDNEGCAIRKDSSEVQTIVRGTAGLLTGYNAVKTIIGAGFQPKSLVRAIAGLIAGYQNDDVVGMLVDKSVVGQTYTDATHAIVLKNSQTGALDIRGRARLVPQS